MSHTPPIVDRPALKRWMDERDLTMRDAAAALRTNRQTMHLILLPFEDPGRRVPQPGLMRRITDWTAGAITYRHFLEPGQNGIAA